MKRGDIFFADLSPVQGSEQGGVRPVVLVQNDLGNRYGSTLIVAAITTQKSKANLPTHVALPKELSGLKRDSLILVEQLRTIDKCRVKEKVCRLSEDKMLEIDRALCISLSLTDRKKEK